LGDFGLLKREDANVEDDLEIYKESFGAGMPARYRTPDQVAYINQESNITTKSDVFQLGLVLAELFTGWNPQKRARKLSDPIEMEDVGNIPGGLSGFIASVINRMLIENVSERESPESLMAAWEGIFEVAIERSYALEGRAI
jgi:serine/threonine protein kinase